MRHPPLLAHDAGEFLLRVGRHALRVHIGTGKDDLAELALLSAVETARLVRLWKIVEARDTFGVVALDGVAQRLPQHAGQPCRLGARQALQCIGDRQHAQ